MLLVRLVLLFAVADLVQHEDIGAILEVVRLLHDLDVDVLEYLACGVLEREEHRTLSVRLYPRFDSGISIGRT